ncbi:MAG: ABC transporter permease, partial [Bacteroidota bacterium]
DKGPLALRLPVYVILAAAVTGFAVYQAPTVFVGLGYAGGVAIVFALLSIVARSLMYGARSLFRQRWTYVLRQGVANLFRPNNQTLLLTTALGLGTFLVLTLFLVQQTLVAQISIAEEEGQPDLVFFDIQTDQVGQVQRIVTEMDVPVVETVPIVSMRITLINGDPVEDLRSDTLSGRSSWALAREYRSTYRDYVSPTERVIEGRFIGQWEEGDGAIPVSFEQDVAEELGVSVGDNVTFNIQGRDFSTTVTSLREVDWRRLSTNFFVVFPAGVLEQAPQFAVMLARAETRERSAAVQRAVVEQHPNVSSIDLNVVLSTFDALFGRIATVLRFIAMFSIVAGVFVLGGAVMVSRSSRTEETVLLKTLGASRRQVVMVMLVEYVVLGVIASLTGILLAYASSWAVARFVFETPFRIEPFAAAAAVAGVIVLALAVGMINSRGIYRRSPLSVLRAEV